MTSPEHAQRLEIRHQSVCDSIANWPLILFIAASILWSMKQMAGKAERKVTISKEWIQKSYEEGHYVEAIIMTHYVIGVYMNWTFEWVTRTISPLASINRLARQSKKKMYPIPNYSFHIIANILYDMGIYNIELYNKLMRLNKGRNTITHRLFEELPGVSKIDEWFKLGMTLWNDTLKIMQQRQKERLQQALGTTTKLQPDRTI